jgi:hypothetical protein
VAARGSVLVRKDLKVNKDFGKDRLGQPGVKYFKVGYVFSIYIWIQANPRSDVIILDFRKADLEVTF